MSDFYSCPRLLRAAKAHRCEWCGEVIEAGHQYWRRVSNYQGDFRTERWHLECEEALRYFFLEENYYDEYTMRGMVRGKPEFI